MSAESVLIPDDRAFSNFKEECGSEEGWSLTYNKTGMTVWTQTIGGDEEKSLHKIKCRMACKDVPAETMYDVLHDIEYRRKWDANVIETFDIGKLTVNADVGYYSWKCPKPLRNRDVITLRSWLPMGSDNIIMNYFVKHAVSINTVQGEILVQNPVLCPWPMLSNPVPLENYPSIGFRSNPSATNLIQFIKQLIVRISCP
ncbi:LOW QUALITY PROTEIN: START domain-containing protein 10 [Salvelinus sp. IW2-2015]|uniref:LOW QUALITY PROTEIN: START domain-containing protein 10 n=1 Tax=Salvelinus sp. IW2-2015 TaxID=2691554 RepID=UPI0038D4F792